MPRSRPKPLSQLVPVELLKEIKGIRPLRLFINKQKKKGSTENPFSLRVRFCQLPKDRQARFLQKAVDKYIALLDEKDVDENVQIDCKLFDYLLMKSEQKKYFESINAPIKPPGTAVPFYTQIVKQEHEEDDNNEMEWKSLSPRQKQNFKKMRKEAKLEYSAQVRNFANDLPERLQIDYLIYAQELPNKSQINSTPVVNGHDHSDEKSEVIRRRRKSLTALPDSLQTSILSSTTDDTQSKLTKSQLSQIHESMPSVLYYENEVSNDVKPTFTRTMTKNAYIRSVFHQLSEEERLKYILISIEKWKDFLQSNPNIIENQIPTLHLLITRNEDIILYFQSIGLPIRPPINSYLLFNYEKYQADSAQSWSDLSQTQRHEYSQQLIELKNEYYQKLVEFIDTILPNDHMKYEFFRNIKYALKDYELASRSDISEKNTGQFKSMKFFKPKEIHQDINQFNQVKDKLLGTDLTNEQRNLIEELSQLLHKYIE